MCVSESSGIEPQNCCLFLNDRFEILWECGICGKNRRKWEKFCWSQTCEVMLRRRDFTRNLMMFFWEDTTNWKRCLKLLELQTKLKVNFSETKANIIWKINLPKLFVLESSHWSLTCYQIERSWAKNGVQLKSITAARGATTLDKHSRGTVLYQL